MDLLIVAVLRGYEREMVVAEVFETTLEDVEKDTTAAMQRLRRQGYQIASFSITKI